MTLIIFIQEETMTRARKNILSLILLLTVICPLALFAEEDTESTPVTNEFRHVIWKDASAGQRLLELGIVYTVQWSYYLVFQWDTIQEHGSWKNYQNIYQPHFDRDSYNYNLIYHTITGTYYYLFYRSRGNTKGRALMWSAISQLLFEFTIEVITEPPSFQDMYQTPIFGAIVGMGLEYLSTMLLNTDCVAAHILGYVLNPFALLPFSSYETAAIPMVTRTGVGYSLSFRF